MALSHIALNHLRSLANLSAAALVLGKAFTKNINLVLFIVGVLVYSGLVLVAYFLIGGDEKC